MRFRNVALLSGLAVVLSVPSLSFAPALGLAHAEEPSIEQLQHDLYKQTQVIQTITRIVPLPGQSAVPAQLTTPAGVVTPVAGDALQAPPQMVELPPELAKKLEFARGVLQNKWVQKYLRIALDPDVQKSLTPLIENPKRVDWIFAELGWLVFIMVFKAWRMTKVKGIAGILGLQFLSLGAMVSGVLYFIPMFLFGNDYSAFVNALIAAAQR